MMHSPTHIEPMLGKDLAHSAILAQGMPLSLPAAPNVAICGEAVMLLINDRNRVDPDTVSGARNRAPRIARRPNSNVATSLNFIPFGRVESDSYTITVLNRAKQMNVMTAMIVIIMIITAVEQSTYHCYHIVDDVACRRPWSMSTVWCMDGAPAVHTPVEQALGAAKTFGNGGTPQVECQELVTASEGVCGAQGNRGEKKRAQSPSLSVVFERGSADA
jgi:hypothetical protein